jgi:hypothetical protein
MRVLGQMAVQTGVAGGRAKSVAVYSQTLYLEGLRTGPLAIPLAEVLYVVRVPAGAGSPSPRMHHVALLLRAPLGKSDVILLSVKAGETVPLVRGPHPLPAPGIDLGQATDAVLAAVVPVLAHVPVHTADNVVVAYLKATEGQLCLLPCGVLFLNKGPFFPIDNIAGLAIAGRTTHTISVQVS